MQCKKKKNQNISKPHNFLICLGLKHSYINILINRTDDTINCSLLLNVFTFLSNHINTDYSIGQND